MQNALRPYATAGVALVGASIIAVTPLAVPPPKGRDAAGTTRRRLVGTRGQHDGQPGQPSSATPARRTSRSSSISSSPTRSG